MLQGEQNIKSLDTELAEQRRALGAAEIQVSKLQNALAIKDEELSKLSQEIETQRNVSAI